MRSKKDVWKTTIGLLFTSCLLLLGYLFCDQKKNGVMLTASGEIFSVKKVYGEEEETVNPEVLEVKKLAITFDDGPHPVYTPMLLDGLKARGVRASFFLLGSAVEKYPDVVRRIHNEGHLIGNHSYNHKDLQNGDALLIQQEVIKTNEAIEKITGKKPEYIRPPFGNYRENLEELSGMIVVLWDVDPLDWCCQDPAAIERRIEEGVKENEIILMHDSSKYSVMAILTAIDHLQKKGYEFVTVDEMVFE